MLRTARAGGRRLFLATNSLWDYTNVVMNYLLLGKTWVVGRGVLWGAASLPEGGVAGGSPHHTCQTAGFAEGIVLLVGQCAGRQDVLAWLVC
jgi:hypothetical protein